MELRDVEPTRYTNKITDLLDGRENEIILQVYCFFMKNRISQFQALLLHWYKDNGRSLPWRQTNDPYAILVSEIMLQQTQVERVLPKYKEFLRRFPTVHELANAAKSEILVMWSGLGYNSRALRLQKTAQKVVQNYRGVFPQTKEELLELPGIGPYTSGAIMAFAFHKPVSFVDTNIKRVVHRVFLGLEFQGWLRTEKEMGALCEEVCAYEHSYAYHQALMDIGARICTARKPQCDQCPLEKVCVTAAEVGKDNTLLESPRISYKKTTTPFKESKRYIRGGIIEKLRQEKNIGLTELYTYVCTVLRSLQKEDFEAIVMDLEKEGLVTIKGDRIILG